ncbi:S8 family serine peptidase [Microbaculum marinum]|uniref:S8 family serine peptidase n=1 Tax=Microbaculum marinum TaxID=1764581 RepID=A0AAW9RWQ7_9HYPH
MASEWKQAGLEFGTDPYCDWSLGPGRDFLLGHDEPDPWFTTLLRRGTDPDTGDVVTTARLKSAFNAAGSGTPGKDPVAYISAYFDRLRGKSRLPAYITAIVSAKFFKLLAERPDLQGLVPAAVLGLPAGFRTPFPAPRSPSPTGPCKVVVGVIDDGLAIAHERFRHADGTTRIAYAWAQDGPVPASGAPAGFGREYDKAAIDQLLLQCTHGGLVDEDAFYRIAGLADFGQAGHKGVAGRSSHGTHVMDLAAGYDPRDGEGAERAIVCVQLPSAITADTSGARLDPYVHLAMNYILDRADWIARQQGSGPLPVVINFSYGTVAGPHDGTSELEAAIDEFVQIHTGRPQPVSVVLPSGNSHLSRCHAQLAYDTTSMVDAEAATSDLEWRVLPDDRTSSFVEIWLPYAPPPVGASRVELQIAPPGSPTHPTSPWIGEEPGQGVVWERDGQVVCKAVYTFDPDPNPTGRGRFVVAIRPTVYLGAPKRLAPSGVWRIRIRNISLGSGEIVHAWVQRDDTPHGYPTRGRQAFFDHASYERFDTGGFELETDSPACIVKRAGLINAIATGEKPAVIGGYLRKEAVVSKYSAGGPTTPVRDAPAPWRTGPDAVAVGDDSLVHWGVLAAGTRSGSTVALTGTSVAAPQVTRWIADRFVAGDSGDRTAVAGKATQDEAGRSTPAPPVARGGAGRLDLPPGRALPRFWP